MDYKLEPVPRHLNLPGHSWAEPSIPHLRALMRRVFLSSQEREGRGRAARERMVSKFTPEAIARQVEVELVRIRDAMTARREAGQRDEL